MKLILRNPLCPGDILMMTCAIRDLHLAYPNKYKTDVRSPCNEIFENNHYITPIKDEEADRIIQVEYPLIHQSGITGFCFNDGHRMFLENELKIKIPKTSMRPMIVLNQSEINWINPVKQECGYSGKYWILNAGSKNDYTLKQYPFYQEVVNLLKDKVQFVQVGHDSHIHERIEGTIDMRGKTDIRQLFRLSYHAEGAVCPVTLQMVIMQAFAKPCVIVAGGREGMRWQAHNDHVFLHTNGLLPCCLTDGCWKSRWDDCQNKVNNIPKCMILIRPEDIARAIMLYYEGGRLS